MTALGVVSVDTPPEPAVEAARRPPPRLPLAEGPGTTSAARVLDDWYVACTSRELGKKPKAVMLFGMPLVVFRTAWGVGAMLDRCPHRNVPLSAGRVVEDRIECAYHGWQIDRTGKVQHIPCLVGDVGKRRVKAFAARELDGHVWVYATPDVEPERGPFRFPHVDDPRYTVVTAQLSLEGTLHAAAENALDVPHTAFLHGGLFRTPDRRAPIDVVIRRTGALAEAEYIGESAPTGVLGRVLAPSGGVVTHFDRFLMPCVTQVEYRLGDDSHLVVNAALTPESDSTTRLYGVATFRIPLRVPGRVLGNLLKPLALVVLGQDKKMLRLQAGAIERFGGEHLTSTEVDCLGPHILKLLKDAEANRRAPDDEVVFERRIQMLV